MHPLQQSTLNSIEIFNGSNKAEFTVWMQSVENTARLCHLDTLSIALSKLQGALLKSASYLETKEANTGKTLTWSTLKRHLTSNCSEIPYDTHAINAYDDLQQATMSRQKPIFTQHKTSWNIYTILMICHLLQQLVPTMPRS